MNKELIVIFQVIQNQNLPRGIKLCDEVVNRGEENSYICESINCSACPINRVFNSSSKNFATQMKLTMETVNHETRNPTPD